MDQNVDIAVICALELEAAPLVRRLRGRRKTVGNRFVLVEGSVASRRLVVAWTDGLTKRLTVAADAVLFTHKPRWLVAAGFAVGLSDAARIGDIVLASELVDKAGNCLNVGIRLAPEDAAAPGTHAARLVSVARWPHSIADKHDLHVRTGAVAADSQSFSLAKICAEQQTKFLAIRVLADDGSRDADPELLAVYHPSVKFRWGAAVGALLRGTGRATKVWKLRSAAKRHAERLADFIVQVLPRLP